MGCKCCRWPVNACRMARLVKLLPLSFTLLVLFLTVHSFYNDALVTGMLLLILFFPVLGLPSRTPLKVPPGPTGVPVLGYLPFLGENPHQEMAKLAKKYGPLVHIQLGSFPGIVVANTRLAKKVLITEEENFASRPDCFVTWAEHFANSDEDSGVGYSTITAKPGSFLRTMRRLVALELMASKSTEFSKAIRGEEMDGMAQRLQSEAKDGRHVVDLHMAISAMAVNVMTRTLIKKRYDAKEAYEFQKLLGAVLKWAGQSFLQDFVPGLRPLMTIISSNEREMARTAKHTNAFLESILREHRQNTVEEASQRDFLDVLVQSVAEDGKRLDDKAIKAVAMEMLMLGTETTATATEWTLAELIRHPRVQSKLQAELDAAIGIARMAQESDIPNLTYLHAVMREVFRLHPVAPLLIPHSNSEATDLDGYYVPANSFVFVNVWAIGRDPTIWARPEAFDPDRFAGRNFGTDPIVDMVAMSATVVVSLAVARLAHGFRWSVADDRAAADLDMGERFGLSLQMKAPLCRVHCEARLPVEAYG